MTRLLLVAAALAILVLAGTTAAAMPHVPYFSQCDPQWQSDRLGGDGPTIRGMGCAPTSAAMVMAHYGADTDPERLNDAILPVIRDGDGDDNIGVHRPGTGEFLMEAGVPDVSASKTIYVDDDFGDDPPGHRWDTIQEGVNDAADGDTVVVYAGEYVENVDVNKPITLQGEGADLVTVAAKDSWNVFVVTASWVKISGFTVTGATQGDGIQLNDANHCNISDNNVVHNYRGIYIGSSSNNTLASNTIRGNTFNFCVMGYDLSHYIQNIDTSNTVDGKPIYYWVNQQNKQIPCDAGYVGIVNCTNITVRCLTLTKNHEGVLFAYTENSRIENVTTSNNGDGIFLWDSNNNTLHNNTASDNMYGICMVESDGNTLQSNTANSNNIHGILLACSSNNMLQRNTANSNNYRGIHLQDSSNNMLRGNAANSNNRYGIYLLLFSSNNTLTGNRASNNDMDGIYIDYSSNNTLTGNRASNNDRNGIFLYYSSDNTLYHNNLVNNTDHNAYDTGTNTWDSGSAGNYYSDYTGTNTDGIGNDPHQIPGGESEDRYPLMHPWAATTPQNGDLDSDNQITPADAAIALRITAGGSASCDLATLTAADVSGDGRATSLDALMILQAAAGAIEL